MKNYGRADVKIHIFLTMALAGGKWSSSRLERFPTRGKAPVTNWKGAGLDTAEERTFSTLPGLKLRLLGHPAHSQSLYRLRYPGSNK
jgi:hypothetical protein